MTKGVRVDLFIAFAHVVACLVLGPNVFLGCFAVIWFGLAMIEWERA